MSIVVAMNEAEISERRVERTVFETDRHRIVGDITLAPTGYKSRFSDSINRADLEFLQLTNVEITSLEDGSVSQRAFVVVSKRHVQLCYPASE